MQTETGQGQRPDCGVYRAINAVQAELVKEGITKDRENAQQGFMYRGIDEVYNALSPLLAKHGLCILPRMLARQCDERQSSKGGALFYVTVEAEFDFVCAADGSRHIVRTFGEAMDIADKATNKAMSAAYKYAAFQAFAIPTEGDNDADGTTPEVTPRQAAEQARPQAQNRPTTQLVTKNESQGHQNSAAASESQIKAIWAITKGKGLDAHQAAGSILGRTVESLNDLSIQEASKVIDGLNKGEGGNNGRR